jgi:hypothetical protein
MGWCDPALGGGLRLGGRGAAANELARRLAEYAQRWDVSIVRLQFGADEADQD